MIYLNKKHIAQAHCALDNSTDITTDTATKKRKFTKLPVVDFDPVKIFVKELEVIEVLNISSTLIVLLPLCRELSQILPCSFTTVMVVITLP